MADLPKPSRMIVQDDNDNDNDNDDYVSNEDDVSHANVVAGRSDANTKSKLRGDKDDDAQATLVVSSASTGKARGEGMDAGIEDGTMEEEEEVDGEGELGADASAIANTADEEYKANRKAIDSFIQRLGIQISVNNVVATIDLKTPLDLKTIALHARNAEYNPKRFSAVIMRLRDPKTTGLIFSSGKVVITGARSEEHCKLAAKKFARIIQKLKFPVRFTSFKLQNVVGSCDLRFPIRLEGLVNDHSRFSSYEPELFPGLIYRLVEPKIVLLVFVSGKIVVTGGKTTLELYQAIEKMYPVLVEYRKQVVDPYAANGVGDMVDFIDDDGTIGIDI